jgi:GNAT superfamily N-acetyltransferase
MGDCPSGLVLRIGTPDDAPVIAEMVGELASYEKLADSNRCTPEAIRAELRDPRRVLEVLIAEVKGQSAGLASFFTTYSTFAAKRGIYLEDIIVKPAFRHRGVGSALMRELARIAHERDCGRMEWTTLLWNTPAIEFYESLNATPNEAWTTYRLTGVSLKKLAADAATAAHDLT